MNEFILKTIQLIDGQLGRLCGIYSTNPEKIDGITESGLILIKDFKNPDADLGMEDQLNRADQKFQRYTQWMLDAQAIKG